MGNTDLPLTSMVGARSDLPPYCIVSFCSGTVCAGSHQSYLSLDDFPHECVCPALLILRSQMGRFPCADTGLLVRVHVFTECYHSLAAFPSPSHEASLLFWPQTLVLLVKDRTSILLCCHLNC